MVCRHSNKFTCLEASHFWFHVFHLCERTRKFMNICITAAPFGTAFPRTVVTHASVFRESEDVSVFVTKHPTDQKSGLFVIVDCCRYTLSIEICAISMKCELIKLLDEKGLLYQNSLKRITGRDCLLSDSSHLRGYVCSLIVGYTLRISRIFI